MTTTITSTSTTTAAAVPKIVAVTGASGFLGAHLCQNLLDHGDTVRACVRQDTPDRTDHLRAMTGAGCLEIHVADMKDAGAYDDIFRDCHAVFHVAGR